MAMNLGTARRATIGDINITPLVDVVLVLLIIFMVLTPSMLKHVRVAVPDKPNDASVPPSDEMPIVVGYTAQRALTINTEPVPPLELGDRLARRLRFDARKVVFFKAEDQVPYGEVVKLMDIARGAGAKTLAIVTK